MGNELFFIVFNTFMLWEIDMEVGRRSMLCWCFLYFFGQALKDLLALPRPPAAVRLDRARATDAWPCCAWRRRRDGSASDAGAHRGLQLPPAAAAAAVAAGGVVSLEQHYAVEYGMPSTHAMNSLGLPWSLVRWAARSGRFTGSPAPLMAFAAFYTLASTASRPYMGVHSPADIAVGLLLGAAIFTASQLWFERLDVWLMTTPGAWAVALAGGAVLVAAYPRPAGKWKSTPGDTTLVVASTAGVHMGCALRAQFEPARRAPHFGLPAPTLAAAARITVGLALCLLARALLKPMCAWLLQGLLGPRWGNAADVESNAREGDTPARLISGAVAGGRPAAAGAGGAPSPAGFPEGASSSARRGGGERDEARLRGAAGGAARASEGDYGGAAAPPVQGGGGGLRIKLPPQPESSPEGSPAPLVLVPPDQRYDVELPTKFIVYGTLGFIAAWVAPAAHAWLGLARSRL
jgi:membrane-associated phospholipid phosphatase